MSGVQLVRAAVLTNYLEVARTMGLNPQPLLRQVGLTQALLADPEQRIPLASAVALLEASAQAGNCPSFGLRMAASRQLADFGVVSLLISHQPTLRAALASTIQYRHLLNDALAMQIEDAGSLVIVREEVVFDATARQATELAIGTLARMCATLLGPRWRPISVNFTHAAPADVQLHRRVFGARVDFDSEFNGFVCTAADLDAPNPTADPAMARYAQRFVESFGASAGQSVVLDVRKAIYLILPTGRATSASVAMGLGLSLRTMQRQLDEAGETFSGLLNAVRQDLVRRYMDTPRYSLARIAELLGYGTPGSFTRWFTAQFGMSPQAWRLQQRQRAASGQVVSAPLGDAATEAVAKPMGKRTRP